MHHVPCAAKRGFFKAVLFLAGFACPQPAAYGQQPTAMFRVGVLASQSRSLPTMIVFRQSLSELGYKEGQNIVLDFQNTQGNEKQLGPLAAKLIQSRPHVIVVTEPAGARAVLKADATIPIVMTGTANALTNKLAESLARPGGNVTGPSTLGYNELSAKRLELLKEIQPKVTRVAVLDKVFDEDLPKPADVLRPLAQTLGIRLHTFNVATQADIPGSFAVIAERGIDSVLVLSQAILIRNRAAIVRLAKQYRLWAIYPAREYVDSGGLMSYGVSRLELYRRAAFYVDKILKGAKPAELPLERPMSAEFVVNLKAAKDLRFKIPPQILIRADEVIQ